jgi:hypothetical protein
MKKIFNRFRIVRDATSQQIEKWSTDLIVVLRETAHEEAKLVDEYVAQVRRLNPDKTPLELAKRIMWRRSLKAGGLGGVCGVGGFITLPVTMPTNLYYTFRIQARLTLATAHIYGWNITEDDAITDMLLVMGGSTSIEAAKSVGVSLGTEFAKKAVQKYVTRDVMKKINSVISRKIITKAGEKSLLSFVELVPLVGAPIGAGFDFFGTLAVGHAAIKFYST